MKRKTYKLADTRGEIELEKELVLINRRIRFFLELSVTKFFILIIRFGRRKIP